MRRSLELESHLATLTACWSPVESPACGAIRLRSGDPNGGVKREAIQVPGRRTGARGTIRRRERVTLHFCRPPGRAVQLSHLLQRRLFGDPARFAFQYEV